MSAAVRKIQREPVDAPVTWRIKPGTVCIKDLTAAKARVEGGQKSVRFTFTCEDGSTRDVCIEKFDEVEGAVMRLHGYLADVRSRMTVTVVVNTESSGGTMTRTN